uniref:Urokinase-type plasminogen activator n=1 Tax=Melopsittacus undulatus TaxID=13146 RepID=A0A8C6NDD5_MELUD
MILKHLKLSLQLHVILLHYLNVLSLISDVFYFTECHCLNGGTCITYYLFSGINRCICPEGYTGINCEIDTASMCYTENGEDYRGMATEDECLPWDLPSVISRGYYHARTRNALQLGLGKHNYCRNPNGRDRPWCYTKKVYTIQETPCNMAKCGHACGQRSMSKYYKIVGGSQAEVESQPWIAGIFQNIRGIDQFLCGGSLIDPCWVLTAAHCFHSPSKKPQNKSAYKVFLGKSMLNVTDDKEQVFMVDDIITHPDFTDDTGGNDNDIALIRIRTTSGQCAVESKYVRTVCLPEKNLYLADNTRCEIAGYGKQEFYDIYAQRLMSATVNLISQRQCKHEYYDSIRVTDNMVCAGDPMWESDACKGDSGGPMVCEYDGRMMLYGIVSWGDGCAKKNNPGVYTRVTRYLNWIDSNMNAVIAKSQFVPEPK